MKGWQAPKEGKKIYLTTDNTVMDDFFQGLLGTNIEDLQISSRESVTNLGLHYYNNQLYTSNYVGLCRLKNNDGNSIYDADGNELLLNVIPRFNVDVTKLLNYIKEDDEFDRYMAPQTSSNRYDEKGIAALDQNELFYFFENEAPLNIGEGVSTEGSIITVTAFLAMLKILCKRPLMGRMLKEEKNLTGKAKGRIDIGKNIRANIMHGRNDRFYCKYLCYTDDIPENQFLKAALKKAKRFVVDYFGAYGGDNNQYSGMLAFCSKSLQHVSDVPVTSNMCTKFKFSGCYSYYKPIITMAQMILDDISVEFNGGVTTTGHIIPYAVSMEKLFEVFVRAYLKKNGIMSYKSNGEHGIKLDKYDKKIDVFLENENLQNPGKYISGPIKPDILLTNQDTGENIVLDVKYKDYTSGNSREDRLQLLAYSMMLNANNIGIILPTQTESMVFDARDINSMETRTIKYHQMLLGMDGGSQIADYIKGEAFA